MSERLRTIGGVFLGVVIGVGSTLLISPVVGHAKPPLQVRQVQGKDERLPFHFYNCDSPDTCYEPHYLPDELYPKLPAKTMKNGRMFTVLSNMSVNGNNDGGNVQDYGARMRVHGRLTSTGTWLAITMPEDKNNISGHARRYQTLYVQTPPTPQDKYLVVACKWKAPTTQVPPLCTPPPGVTPPIWLRSQR